MYLSPLKGLGVNLIRGAINMPPPSGLTAYCRLPPACYS
jgi:hypothetical protein